MNEPIYIDEQQRVLRGVAAEQAMKRQGDAGYLTAQEGIVKVPVERWERAQKFERHHWLEQESNTLDDRNHAHLAGFEGYAALRGRSYAHAIELGCGPFTNMRLIGGLVDIRKVSLLDPLMEEYLKHKNVRYDRNVLHCETRLSRLANRPGWRRVGNVLRRLSPGLFTNDVKIEEMYPVPIEQMPIRPVEYDLVVMINVIEHCYDIELIFKNIRSIGRPGGLFVFHDKYYEHEKISDQVRNKLFDAGHPLRVDRAVIDKYLSGFDPVYQMVQHHNHSFEDLDLSYDAVYFVGRFRG